MHLRRVGGGGDNAAQTTMSTTTATPELARQAARGFCLGGPTRPAHRPDGLRPPSGEQAENQRRTVRRPKSKFLSVDLTNTFELVIITHNHMDHTMASRTVVEKMKLWRLHAVVAPANPARTASRETGK